MLSRLELHQTIKDLHPRLYPSNLSQSIKKLGYDYLIDQIEYHTQYISDRKFKEKYYHILHNITERPKCTICGNVELVAFGTIEKGYLVSMCKSCSSKNRMINGSIKLSKTIRGKHYNRYVEMFKNEYTVLTDRNEFIETGIMRYIHNVCNKTTERDIAYQNGCKWCSYIGTSKAEKEIRNWIEQYIDIDFNKRKYLDNKYEIDIYIPSKNIGIEYNGLWWHSENNNTPKNYHLDKLNYAISKGIKLIQVFENEWLTKQDIVKSIILSKLSLYGSRIYARKCQIHEVDVKTSNLFLDANHIQGKCKSSTQIGLFYQDELISLMTFGSRKITNRTSFELLRFCNKINTQVIGGASKLFKHFINTYNTNEPIVSYADKRYSDGGLYNILGFIELKDSPPNYWYFKKGSLDLLHRSGFMKHTLSNKLNKYDNNLTEYENMVNNGYNRVWDCGNKVFTFINSNIQKQ